MEAIGRLTGLKSVLTSQELKLGEVVESWEIEGRGEEEKHEVPLPAADVDR